MAERDQSLLSFADCARICREARAEADAVGGEKLRERALRRERAEVLSERGSVEQAMTPEELKLCVELGLVRSVRATEDRRVFEYELTHAGRMLV